MYQIIDVKCRARKDERIGTNVIYLLYNSFILRFARALIRNFIILRIYAMLLQ